MKDWPGECQIVNGRPRHPQCQGLIEQGNGTVEKLLGVRLHESDVDFPPWSENAAKISLREAAQFINLCVRLTGKERQN